MERHYNDGTEPDVLPHWGCNGPCNQGRLRCPTPAACRVPEGEEFDNRFPLVMVCIALVAAWGCIAVLAIHVFG